MCLAELDLSEWRVPVPDSGFEAFHTLQALEALDGQRCIGLYDEYSGNPPDREFYTALSWQGSVWIDYNGASVNSYRYRQICEDIFEESGPESTTGCDLVGAHTSRFRGYKAKIGGEILPYHAVESTGAGMAVTKRASRIISK